MEIKPLSEYDEDNYLAEVVAVMKLNNIEFGRLSVTGLRYILSYTY